MYESLGSKRQITKSTKSQIKLNFVRQIEVLRFIRIVTPVSGKARQNYFLNELNHG